MLHFIWRMQLLNNNALQTTCGKQLKILYPGLHNHNQGPDFLQAKIEVDGIQVSGSIEIHVQASDWLTHKHTGDEHYKNVILHVVWQDDAEIDFPLLTLELQPVVSSVLLMKYEEMMLARAFIPCENLIADVPELTINMFKERLIVERLGQRKQLIDRLLLENQRHWEQTFWIMLAKNFGVSLNTDAFEAVARSLPVQLLAKHKMQIHQLEALLLGQAGLLAAETRDDYVEMLLREYKFLQKKYSLNPITIPLQYLRMRPANFPAVRLAQLAMLIHRSIQLFSQLRECGNLAAAKKLLSVTANDYWHYHYQPGKIADYSEKRTGSSIINNLLINTVIPMLHAYGQEENQPRLGEKAISWLMQISAEENTITRSFKNLGIYARSAYDSQALLQLKKYYCTPKHCLSCAIGAKILAAKN